MQDNPFRTSFAEEIFHRRYAQGPNDSWAALSERVVEDVCGTRWGTEPFPLLSREERSQLVQYIQQMKFIPGGRYLYYAGRPAHFYNNCFGGETKFLSKEGFQKLRDCVNKPVEVLSPVDGKWKKARVESFGKQQLQEITFKSLRGVSEVEWKIRATRTHHWPLVDGSDTYDLRVGDVVPANPYSLYDDLGYIHGIIFGDGTLEHVSKDGEHTFKVRLCGRKADLCNFLMTQGKALKMRPTVHYPPSANGDPVVRLRSSKDLKGLPVDAGPKYIGGFIQGWFGVDGHENLSASIASVDFEAMAFFRDHAAYAGFVVSGVPRSQTRDTPYKENSTLYIQSVIRACNWKGFKVVDIVPDCEEEVFCVVEPEYNRFVLENNIDTFNCFALKAESDTREEWGNLCKRASDCLMSGGGIGVDYSIIREKGRILSRTGGVASGPIPLMNSINEIGRNVMQGGSRRSAIMATLNWQHPDSKEFVHLKDWPQEIIDLKAKDWNFPAPLDMTNISIGWDDDLLDLTMQGEVPDIWYESVKQMLMTGEPGHLYNFGPKADSTTRNAPVSRDTWVMTDKGYRRVADIWGVPQTVWTGQNWAKDVVFKMTKPRVNTVKVCMTGDRFIKADPTHEFFVERYKGAGKHRRLDRIERVPAEDLQVGDILHVSLPREDEVKPLNECAYTSIKVTAIEEGDEEPVFCCDVKLPEHSFCAEDVIISNCGEIDSEDDSDVCNLGSVNISRIESLDEFKDVCRLGAKFLICGALRGELPYPKVYEVRKRNMRIGLGLMGIHEFLLRHNQPYGVTPELGEYLSAYMEYSEKGANEHCDRFYCPRPLAYRAIAPNGTTGILASTTGGIEPLMAVAYKRRFLKDGTKWKSTYVVDATAQYLIDCVGVDPEAIETAFCLAEDPERRIKFQAQVQQYVDHCISSTINLPAWGTQHNNEDKVDDFANMLLEYAPHLRGITCYPDGSRGGQPIVPTPYKEAIEKQGFIFDEMEEKCAGGVCGL